MIIYTLGYEKRNIDEYIEILKTAKVKKLIDVRETPWSYKKGFSKTKLNEKLRDNGIEYLHIKELGNPKSIRKSALNSAEILSNYQIYLEETHAGIDSLKSVIDLAVIQHENVCLTCFERLHTECHRDKIIGYIKPAYSRVKVVHL